MIFNKIDAYQPEPLDDDDLTTPRTTKHYSLEEWQQSWMANTHGDAIFISAQQKIHIDKLRELLYQKVREIHITRFPYNHFLYPES
jgi:GTP-binding protein HflX